MGWRGSTRAGVSGLLGRRGLVKWGGRAESPWSPSRAQRCLSLCVRPRCRAPPFPSPALPPCLQTVGPRGVLAALAIHCSEPVSDGSSSGGSSHAHLGEHDTDPALPAAVLAPAGPSRAPSAPRAFPCPVRTPGTWPHGQQGLRAVRAPSRQLGGRNFLPTPAGETEAQDGHAVSLWRSWE